MADNKKNVADPNDALIFEYNIGEDTNIVLKFTNPLEQRACFKISYKGPHCSVSPEIGFLNTCENGILKASISKFQTELKREEERGYFLIQFVSCTDLAVSAFDIWSNNEPEKEEFVHIVLKNSNQRSATLTEVSLKNGKEPSNTGERMATEGFMSGSIGAAKNAARYVVKLGGRKSNVVTVFDTASKTAKGYPRWFARVDMPHRNVKYPHINVNPAITKVRDPHIKLSAAGAETAGTIGKVAEKLNKASPYIQFAALAIEVVQVGINVRKDYRNGSTRNTVQHVTTTAASVTGSFAGVSAGASIGTMIFPGIGTIVGGLLGALSVGTVAGEAAHLISEKVMDKYEYDTVEVKCMNCGTVFLCHIYITGQKTFCEECDKRCLL